MPRSPRIIVCACEDVSLGDIDHCLEKGYRDVESVKRYTGFGTGICQGRSCLHLVARILEARGAEAPDLSPITPRPPVLPVPLGLLAGLGAPGGGEGVATRAGEAGVGARIGEGVDTTEDDDGG
jgi:bacterioferritin-associated ferredoxin